MKPGNVVEMKSCTVVSGRNRFTFGPPEGAPRGTTMAFLFLGNVLPTESCFNPEAALNALGWQRIPKAER